MCTSATVLGRMSVEEFAKKTGHTASRIRRWCREIDLNNVKYKTMLDKTYNVDSVERVSDKWFLNVRVAL